MKSNKTEADWKRIEESKRSQWDKRRARWAAWKEANPEQAARLAAIRQSKKLRKK